YWDPEQWPLAREALRQAGRRDLIGGGAQCLVPADTAARAAAPAGSLPGRHARRPLRARKPTPRPPERNAR
ncbi:MAG: DUF3362 domain-containing protein, partial [Deltaproteobacteria bacterium]